MKSKRKTAIRKEKGMFLDSYNRLFQKLNAENISWCSWKSNEHLIDGLEGKTDVDLLFYEQDRLRVTGILHECGFMLFQAPAYKSYPGIIDAIAMDPETGRVLHAHSHFLLTAGEKHLKGVILPWNETILEKSTPSELSPDIFVSSPDVELVLLLVREALKIRNRDTLQQNLEQLWDGKGFNEELEWLKQRTNAKEVKECAANLLDEPIAGLLYEIIEQGATLGRFIALRSLVNHHASEKGWRRIGFISGMSRVWFNEMMYILIRIFEKTGVFKQSVIRRRVLPNTGLIVAFLGPDGSGKSTVSQTIVSECEHKIDVTRIYFGTGEGTQIILQKIISLILHAGVNIKRYLRKAHKQTANENKEGDRAVQNKPSWGTIINAVVGVYNKKKQMRRAQKLREKGFIVICDRWPQNQIHGLNDGPLLSLLRDSEYSIIRKIAYWEEREFDKVCSFLQPDVVVRLIPSLDVAVSRKEENKNIKNLIAKKIETIQKIEFVSGVEDHALSADEQLDDVLMQVREIIWRHLQQRPMYKPGLYECFGLPGSGKTTACNAAYKKTKTKAVDALFSDVNTLATSNKVLLTLQSFFYEARTYFYIVRLGLAIRAWKSADACSYLFRLPVQKMRMIRNASNSRFLMEQLLLQNLWSALISTECKKVRTELLIPVIKSLYRNVGIVILYYDASVETAIQRIKSRKNGTSRLDHMSDEELRFHIERGSILIRDIIRAASFAGLPIVKINAELPKEKLSEEYLIPAIGSDD